MAKSRHGSNYAHVAETLIGLSVLSTHKRAAYTNYCLQVETSAICPLGEVGQRREWRKILESTMDDKNHIDFDAPATLRKWPSIKSERANTADHPYLIVDGTLDHCIRQFVSKPKSQHHLYEIHTAPQLPLVSAVLSARHVHELARLRDFL